ncbi:MAG TPA: ATP-binding protein [Thauera sp.]|uniref:ATP-binding protein n=1 Tax=Thauera sp. TaxID=1905334 RepID=UPI002BDB44CB|nr:ATP-binding protein [Thauera sp.]HRP25245.1 ATP-binding protein [Thauera sp.]HRP64615.1 ATP-binding protein [Thauera sp.]
MWRRNGEGTGLESASHTLSAVRTERGRLLKLRWLSLGAMAVLAFVVFPWLAPAQAMAPLAAVTLGLLAVNLGLAAGAARWLVGPTGAMLQLAIDLLAWGAFLYYAGGVTNPAISLLLPVVAIGASILPALQAWLLAGLAIGLYSLLWQYHEPIRLANAEQAMHWHLAGMWLSFALSAVTVVWFVARLNAELARREDELAEAKAARARDAHVVGLGKLAAGAAHRLGTPLGTLRILADELARRGDVAVEAREDIELMRAQIDHCRDILNSLTREAGQPRAEGGGAIDARRWVEQVAARWQQLRPGVALRIDGEGAPIVADASLGEALHNLIDNAANANANANANADADADADADGGAMAAAVPPVAAVELRLSAAAGMVTVEVADRGPGLPAARIDAARRAPLGAHAQGMGVGLMLAHAAVEHHGGRLAFRPRPGGGTIACLMIPSQAAPE